MSISSIKNVLGQACALVSLLAAMSLPAQAALTLSGTMIDELSSDPIRGGTVELFINEADRWESMGSIFIDNDEGQFSFEDLPIGEYTVLAHNTTRYYPEWYDDVEGWRAPDDATPIFLSSDEDIIVDLMPTPISIELDPWDTVYLPADGGEISLTLKVTNVSGERQLLKAWVVVHGAPTRGQWADIPVARPLLLSIPARKGRIASKEISFRVPPHAVNTCFDVQVYVGSASAAPWEVTVGAGLGVCKGD